MKKDSLKDRNYEGREWQQNHKTTLKKIRQGLHERQQNSRGCLLQGYHELNSVSDFRSENWLPLQKRNASSPRTEPSAGGSATPPLSSAGWPAKSAGSSGQHRSRPPQLLMPFPDLSASTAATRRKEGGQVRLFRGRLRHYRTETYNNYGDLEEFGDQRRDGQTKGTEEQTAECSSRPEGLDRPGCEELKSFQIPQIRRSGIPRAQSSATQPIFPSCLMSAVPFAKTVLEVL